jgi:hypothetical protein
VGLAAESEPPVPDRPRGARNEADPEISSSSGAAYDSVAAEIPSITIKRMALILPSDPKRQFFIARISVNDSETDANAMDLTKSN